MSKLYKVSEFAKISGVTVKALQHYDRVGLLKAARSNASYRVYTESDLERLEQIVALKFIGLGLSQIKAVLERRDGGLLDALRLQRNALEDKRELVTRAIDAISDAEKEIRAGEPVDAAVLKRLIKVIQLGNQFNSIKRYLSGDTFAKFSELVAKLQNVPGHEWKALGHDVSVALKEKNPAGEEAQSLLARSEKLLERSPELSALLTQLSTDTTFRREVKEYSANPDNWQAGLPTQMKESCSEIVEYLRKANMARMKTG